MIMTVLVRIAAPETVMIMVRHFRHDINGTSCWAATCEHVIATAKPARTLELSSGS